MKKLFKIIGSIILILIAVVVFFIFCEYSTTGRTTRSKSRSTYRQIQAAINQTAWDSTAVSFSFRNHHYLWDKKRNLVQVEWDDKKVLYNTQTIEGIA
jgi:apolipoprotein N-acyltransferase